MKKLNRIILIGTSFLVLLLNGCNQFEDINTNPDATTKVTSDLLATGLLLDITHTGNGKYFV